MSHFRIVLQVVAAVIIAAAGTRTATFDPDTWWHLRVGEWIADSGTVPQHDRFSRLGREQPTEWVAYSWLFELGLDRTYSNLGPGGVLGARAALGVLSTASVLSLLVGRSSSVWVSAPAALLIGVVFVPLMRERPWHLTIALTAATVAAVDELRAGARVRSKWWLPPAFALWANLHIQFVLGWLVLGLACLFPGSADRRKFAVFTAACVAATFINPYHVRLLGVVWDYATQTGPLRGVQELAPPDPTQPWTWAGIVLLALGGWAAMRRSPTDWFHAALLVIALVLMMRMRRDVWVAAVVAAAVIPDLRGQPIPARWGVAIWTATAAVFVGFRAATPADSDAANAERYPVRAAEYVRAHRLPGPLFNSFSWGGYLIWALPEHPVSIDGRTNLYGSERVTRALATWAGEPGWDADPDLATANLVVAPKGWTLTELLRGRPAEWRVVFEDDTAVVFVTTH